MSQCSTSRGAVKFFVARLAARFSCQNTPYRTSVNSLITASIFADLADIIAEHNLVHLQHEFYLSNRCKCHRFRSASPLPKTDRMKAGEMTQFRPSQSASILDDLELETTR